MKACLLALLLLVGCRVADPVPPSPQPAWRCWIADVQRKNGHPIRYIYVCDVPR